MKLNKIDYTPLKAMDKPRIKLFSKLEKIGVYSYFGLLAVTIFVPLRAGGFTSFIPFLIVAFVLVGGYLGGFALAQKNTIWKAFAQANGWGVTPGELATVHFVPPSLLDAGSKRKLGDIVHADIDGHMCSVYTYEFVTGSGKSRQNHYYTIARVMLPKVFPHLILDSKKSYAIQDKGKADVPVKLEGDFNDYFTLSHEKGGHIDALSIIAPDVMQTLIDNNAAQDIEIADQSAYFMMHTDHRTIKSLPKLFASVDALSDELVHKAKTLHDKSDTPANFVHITQAASEYFKSGERTITALWEVVVFVLVVIPLLFILLIGIATSLEQG